MTKLAIGVGLLFIAKLVLGTLYGKRIKDYLTQVYQDWCRSRRAQHPA